MEAGRKAYRPQHAQLVFPEAEFRIADGANHTGPQVVATTNEVKHSVAVQWIHQKAVDGKVAALHILLRVLGIAHLIRMAPVGVRSIVTKSGNFHVVGVLGRAGLTRRFARERHQHHAELRSHGVGFREDAHHLGGRGIGGNVVIGGRKPQQHVAYAASGEIRLEAAVAQLANDVGGMLPHRSLIVAWAQMLLRWQL